MLSKHPYDLILHAVLCAIPVYFGFSISAKAGIGFCVVVLIVSVMIEYEQKHQVWYHHLSWKTYLLSHSILDLLADLAGIIIGTIPYLTKL